MQDAAAQAAQAVGRLQNMWDQLVDWFSTNLPSLLAALAVLIVGWLVSLVIAALVRVAVKRTGLGDRIAGWAPDEAAVGREPERWVGKGTFYILMLFVLVAFFQTLGLTVVTEPLNRLLTEIFEFIPRLLGAAILLLIAWGVASLLRLLITRGLSAAKLDERLGDQAGIEEERPVPLTKTLADAVYWLVFLFFVPAVLGALNLEGLLQPVQSMVNEVLAFLPNIFTAAVILGVGWFIARIVQRIVTNLLMAVGVDRLGERAGISRVVGKQGLSGVIGLIVYILVLVPVLVAALNALAIEAVTRPAANMLNAFLVALPALFAAALLIAIAYVVGRVVAGLITNLLESVGFDALIQRLGIVPSEQEQERKPSAIAGYLVLVIILLFATIEALRLVGFGELAELVSEFTVFAGRVILGLVIFAVGLFVANLVANRVLAAGTGQARVLALASRIAILVLAGAMALSQMGLATEIINILFAVVLGAVAVAAAISFGIGGREIAARELEKWVKSIKSQD
ncbi:MAG: mechanosensitive ion channel [Gemmatimonadetes bacterium]|uniref:Mechanosensitive ion channel n=1 Tax=Candidatus Kutchimonas denitrificans TaxID=3056748 RepID=A0AAE4Z9P6_9BACT|nr:mechanosensitive ion channel [Gemmatimonadota bacterium]NIR74081.1 mechanosensitive ion channel [Candidatus Kutchimonas denitrificans]NIS01643.1 mechanosensitive ion channel [Gemmatimonadota bacterium]NIT67381.1 mechanosensitive ion channel [Gemmatimonadota bacterium]NIU52744.1 mechanosensitive ion channel [Gemmatimonadota bacterium]